MSRTGGVRTTSFAICALLLLSSQVHAGAAPVSVEAKGTRSGEGSVRVDLCTAETFLKAACPFSGSAPAVKGVTVVTVSDVPPGTYAAQVYHDVNDNHRVDRNALGIPKEAIGFSNDALIGLHGPSFKHAAFVHGDTPQTLPVKLHHFLPNPRGFASPSGRDRPD